MQTETALSAAMSHAGLNTAEFRLRQAAHDALAKHHQNVERALPTFKKLIDYSGTNELVDAALVFVLRKLSVANHVPLGAQPPDVGDRQANGDERGHHPHETQKGIARSTPRDGEGQARLDNQDKAALPVREPSAAQLAADRKVSHAAALNVFDRELTHTGRRWGNVFYRELDSMMDDGELARAIKAHIGSLRGDERHKTIRDLMTPREFYGVMRKAGRSSNAAA